MPSPHRKRYFRPPKKVLLFLRHRDFIFNRRLSHPRTFCFNFQPPPPTTSCHPRSWARDNGMPSMLQVSLSPSFSAVQTCLIAPEDSTLRTPSKRRAQEATIHDDIHGEDPFISQTSRRSSRLGRSDSLSNANSPSRSLRAKRICHDTETSSPRKKSTSSSSVSKPADQQPVPVNGTCGSFCRCSRL